MSSILATRTKDLNKTSQAKLSLIKETRFFLNFRRRNSSNWRERTSSNKKPSATSKGKFRDTKKSWLNETLSSKKKAGNLDWADMVKIMTEFSFKTKILNFRTEWNFCKGKLNSFSRKLDFIKNRTIVFRTKTKS